MIRVLLTRRFIAGAAKGLAGAPLLVLLAGQLAAQGRPVVPQTPTSYAITLVPSDTGAHVLVEVETGWRLRTVNPVEMDLDTALRVVRVLVDGTPNTRLSRTWARTAPAPAPSRPRPRTAARRSGCRSPPTPRRPG
jgi:hypothetical protein